MDVHIFGGTHGNESNGVWLANHYQKFPHLGARQGLNVFSHLANPLAIEKRQRYCDIDLNRSFNNGDLKADCYEAQCAKNILAHFSKEDLFAIDLHTSTAQMGITLIIAHTDPFVARLAFLAQKKIKRIRILFNDQFDTAANLLICAAPRGLIIEVGGVGQNILNANIIKDLNLTLSTLLDCLEELAATKNWQSNFSLSGFKELYPVAYPKDSAGKQNALIHPRILGRDYLELKPKEPIFIDENFKDIEAERDQVYFPVFINEAAYYEKDIAMVLTGKIEKSYF